MDRREQFIPEPAEELQGLPLSNLSASGLKGSQALTTIKNKSGKVHSGSYNLDQLKKIVGKNKDFITNMIFIFIENSENAIKTFKQSLVRNKWRKTGDKVYKIHPSFYQLEAKEVISELNQIKTITLTDTDYDSVHPFVKSTIDSMELVISGLRKEIKNLDR